MSRSGKIRTFFGDADHDFRIGVGECEELDEKFQLGLMELQAAIAVVRVPIVKEVLRLGLIGGGMRPEPAFRLVDRHVRDGYYLEAAAVALRVMEAAAKGVPDDMPGEPTGEGTTTSPPSPTAASDSPSSIEP